MVWGLGCLVRWDSAAIVWRVRVCVPVQRSRDCGALGICTLVNVWYIHLSDCFYQSRGETSAHDDDDDDDDGDDNDDNLSLS